MFIAGLVLGGIGVALVMGYFMLSNMTEKDFEESSDLFGISDFPLIDWDEKTEKVHKP